MSFRTRLTLFFVLIVVVPVVALGIVATRLVADGEAGRAEARAGAHVTAAMKLYRRVADRGAHAARVLGADPALRAAIRRGDRAAAHARVGALRRRLGAVRVRIAAAGTGANAAARATVPTAAGRVFVDLGNRTAIAAGTAPVRGPRAPADADSDPARGPTGRAAAAALATVEASVITAAQYVRLAAAPGVEIAVHRGPQLLATSLPDRLDASGLPADGDITRSGTRYVAAGFSAADFARTRDRIAVLADAGAGAGAGAGDGATGAVGGGRLALGLLAGVLLLALAGALFLWRQLDAQIGRLRLAARRIGGGDFSTVVPAEGTDAFAALGRELDRMSGRLAQRVGDLRRERARLRGSIERIGRSFAAGRDRTALLRHGVQTAVEAVDARCGRAVLLASGPGVAPVAHAAVGAPTDTELAALREAERRALATGVAASVTATGACALAVPVPRTPAAGAEVDRAAARAAAAAPAEPHGLLCVARAADCPFSDDERRLVASLAAQTGLSLEHGDLRDRARRRAVADELTGLCNHRRFHELATAELAASYRADRPLGLVMIDVDDFKRINDAYGHQQGDVVLRQVAHALRGSCREIDEPARYGGEEFAVALPDTDLDGAYAAAEGIRTAVEALRIPRLDGAEPVRVTVSCGVAATAGAATIPDKDALIAAADAALDRAKRSGKNRTVRAPDDALAPA